MCFSWVCTEGSIFSTGKYVLIQDFPLGGRDLDIFHSWYHPDAALRRFYILLRESKSAVTHHELSSLIVHSQILFYLYHILQYRYCYGWDLTIYKKTNLSIPSNRGVTLPIALWVEATSQPAIMYQFTQNIYWTWCKKLIFFLRKFISCCATRSATSPTIRKWSRGRRLRLDKR